ncbi:hypothetical protein COJ70_23165 [Priestia megaterium]|nr:hypothetical protein COJ00_29390 [Priestia megaterium]PFO13249.1 hypothetical protein COJ70_23165 [Priestia megaterium]
MVEVYSCTILEYTRYVIAQRDECSGYIVVRNATFEDYVRQGERWSKYIGYKEKYIWKVYNVK